MKKKIISKNNVTPLDITLNKSNIITIQENLLNWYNINKRNLPFRKDKNPYKIWVSEIMLQQNGMSDRYHRY